MTSKYVTKSTTEHDVDNRYGQGNSDRDGSWAACVFLRSAESKDNGETNAQKDHCYSEGKELTKIGVTVVLTEVGPDNVLWLWCSSYLKLVVFAVSLVPKFVHSLTANGLDSSQDRGLVKIWEESFRDVGLKGHKNGGKLVIRSLLKWLLDIVNHLQQLISFSLEQIPIFFI